MRFFNKVCFCISLDKGCIWIAVLGIGLSGIVLLIQRDPEQIIGFILSVLASFFLLLGILKQIKPAIIIYLILEMAQVIELLISTIITLVALLINQNFVCDCDSHECEEDVAFCKMIGTILVSVGCADIVVSIYLWLCVLSFARKMSSDEQVISVF